MKKFINHTYFQAALSAVGITSLFFAAKKRKEKDRILRSELIQETLYYIHCSKEFQDNFESPLTFSNGLIKQLQIKLNEEENTTQIQIPYKVGKDEGIAYIFATKKPLSQLTSKYYLNHYYINEGDTKNLIKNQNNIDPKEKFYNIDLIKLENKTKKNKKNILIQTIQFDDEFQNQFGNKKTYNDIHQERKIRRQYMNEKFGNNILKNAIQQYKNQELIQNRILIGQLIFGTLGIMAIFINAQFNKNVTQILSNSIIVQNYQKQIQKKIQNYYGIKNLYFNQTILGGINEQKVDFEMMFHGPNIFGKAYFKGKQNENETIDLDLFQLKCNKDGKIHFFNMQEEK